MSQLTPSVLIIGYGKIGKIKAQIWKRCGANVSVFDIEKERVQCARIDNFNIDTTLCHISYSFVDICTPSSTHIEVLNRLIVNDVRFNCVIIEKPLFNNSQEKKMLDKLLDNDASLYGKILVNEQYYRSKAIKLLQEKIPKDKITHIEITMSKNRKIDNKNGRFIDNDIGAYGIELPHILAVLERLDISTEDIKPIKNLLYIDSEDKNNQGIIIKFITNADITITINSFLGDFKISSNNEFSVNETIDRNIMIKGEEFEYRVILDPHPVNKRLITELNLGAESTWIHDDMLKANISDIISGHIVEGCKLGYAIKQSKQIMSLFYNAKTIKIIKENNYAHNS
ncbi:Gfo/Idh/MocA family oxidoreductase [Bacillus cereus]